MVRVLDQCRSLQVSDDGRYVLLSIREGCDPVNRLWYCDLQTTPQGITGTPCLHNKLIITSTLVQNDGSPEAFCSFLNQQCSSRNSYENIKLKYIFLNKK